MILFFPCGITENTVIVENKFVAVFSKDLCTESKTVQMIRNVVRIIGEGILFMASISHRFHTVAFRCLQSCFQFSGDLFDWNKVAANDTAAAKRQTTNVNFFIFSPFIL